MTKIAVLIKKDGTELKGYWNGKNYNGVIYFNVSTTGLKKDVNWKKAEQIKREDIKSLAWINESANNNMPKTTAEWMAEMARAEGVA